MQNTMDALQDVLADYVGSSTTSSGHSMQGAEQCTILLKDELAVPSTFLVQTILVQAIKAGRKVGTKQEQGSSMACASE